MRLLVDTCVFLELLLAQSKADEARKLLENPQGHELSISDYSLHSLGVLLLRHKRAEALRLFLRDMFANVGVTVLSLKPDDLGAVIEAAHQFGLDFDDAYQYMIAEKYGLTIVSFDSDFDRTAPGRKTPGEVS